MDPTIAQERQRSAIAQRALDEQRKAQQDPATMFHARYPGYEFDARGIPLRAPNGEELSPTARAKLEKAYNAQVKRHAAYNRWLARQ